MPGTATAKAEALQPTPTQAELNDAMAGKDRDKTAENEISKKGAEERGKAAEMVPTPTQAENDAALLKALNIKEADARAEIDKRTVKAYEVEQPTPTQAENDTAKLAAMPGEALPPLPPQAPPYDPPAQQEQAQARRKQSEAGRAPSNYETRNLSATAPKE